MTVDVVVMLGDLLRWVTLVVYQLFQDVHELSVS